MKTFNKGNKGCLEHLPLKVIRSQLKNNFGVDGHPSEPPLNNARDSLSSHLDKAPVHHYTTQNLGLGTGRLNVLQVLLSNLRMTRRRNTSTAQRRTGRGCGSRPWPRASCIPARPLPLWGLGDRGPVPTRGTFWMTWARTRSKGDVP